MYKRTVASDVAVGIGIDPSTFLHTFSVNTVTFLPGSKRLTFHSIYGK